jgi:hypothetical protein
MSFGESMFAAGFNQKTTKEDLFIKGNLGISSCNQCGKTLHRSKARVPDMWGWRASHVRRPVSRGPTYQPPCYVGFPLPPRMHLHFKSV